MTELRFERYCFQRKPGDRARHTVDCYMFKVTVNGFTAAVFDQYESWMEHVGDYKETYRRARKYADGLADVLEARRPQLVKMVEKEVEKVEWVEDGTVDGEGNVS